MVEQEEIADLLRSHRMRRSEALRLVLAYFVQHPTSEHYGLEVLGATGLRPASVYPLLRKMSDAGLLRVRADPGGRQGGGPPARVYYRLTESGFKVGTSLLSAGEVVSGMTPARRRGAIAAS